MRILIRFNYPSPNGRPRWNEVRPRPHPSVRPWSTTPTEKGFCASERASGAKLPLTFCLNRIVIMRSVLARGPIFHCMMHAAHRPLRAGSGERGLAFQSGRVNLAPSLTSQHSNSAGSGTRRNEVWERKAHGTCLVACPLAG